MLKLLMCFLKIGLFSIGGGYATIPLIQQEIVQNHHWIDLTTFTDIITISQMTPGPLAVNVSTFTGIRIGGLTGAMLATFGCVITGILISLGLHQLFCYFSQSQFAQTILRSLQAASVGLIAASAFTIVQLSCFFDGLFEVNFVAVAVVLISFVLLKKKTNSIFLLLAGALIGVLFY